MHVMFFVALALGCGLSLARSFHCMGRDRVPGAMFWFANAQLSFVLGCLVVFG